MASSSGSRSAGSSSAATATGGSSSEELRALMEQRRAKRMLSNRESARRSRMRKQKHLDDLTAQVAHLRRENAQIATALGLTAQSLLAVDAENSVLRTQAAELSARLHSLTDILSYMNNNANSSSITADPLGLDTAFEDFFRSSPEMFQYC